MFQLIISIVLCGQFGGLSEEIAEWNGAKKLSLSPIPPGMDYASATAGTTDPDGLREGDLARLARWNYEVLSVVDDKNVLLQLGVKRRLWLQGYDTAGLVNDEKVRILDWVVCIGTKTYTTVAGSKDQVLAVRMLSEEDHRDLMKKRAEEAAEQAERDRLAKFRVLKSASGKHEINAIFVKYLGGRIFLETIEGRELTVTFADLDDESADFIRGEIKSRRNR